jgi:hypothetical protein
LDRRRLFVARLSAKPSIDARCVSTARYVIAGLKYVSGKGVARKPSLLQLGIRQSGQLFVHGGGGVVVGTGVRPRHNSQAG